MHLFKFLFILLTYFNFTQAYLFHVVAFKDTNNREIILYGDVHNIHSKRQVSILQSRFIEIRDSNLLKSKKIQVYYEGFTQRKNFEEEVILDSNKIGEETLNFIHNFSKQNKDLFHDIENRVFIESYDELISLIKSGQLIMPDDEIFNLMQIKNFIKSDLEQKIEQFWIKLNKEINTLELEINNLNNKSEFAGNLKKEINHLKALYKPCVDLFAASLLKPNINITELLNNLQFIMFQFCSILDLNFLINFEKNKKTKRFIFFAGDAHIQNISKILEASNFTKFYEINVNKKDFIKLLYGQNLPSDKEIPMSAFDYISRL